MFVTEVRRFNLPGETPRNLCTGPHEGDDVNVSVEYLNLKINFLWFRAELLPPDLGLECLARGNALDQKLFSPCPPFAIYFKSFVIRS